MSTKMKADLSHWNDNEDSCRDRMDVPLLHIGDELKFRDVGGKVYIVKVIREAEE